MTDEAQLIAAIVFLFGALQAGTGAVIRYLVKRNAELTEDNEALLKESRDLLAKYQARDEEERTWRIENERRRQETGR